MGELVTTFRAGRPTLDEPLPTLAGTHGLKLLRSATARVLAGLESPSDRAALEQAAWETLRASSPATTLEIGAVLEALALHYPVLRRTDGEARLVVKDWAEDLDGYPLDLVQEGARLWRNSKADRFPTAGQFKAQIEPILKHRQQLARRATDFLELTGSGA